MQRLWSIKNTSLVSEDGMDSTWILTPGNLSPFSNILFTAWYQGLLLALGRDIFSLGAGPDFGVEFRRKVS